MLDNDNKLQQQAIGILGVNMIYACYFNADNLEEFVVSLLDGLKDRISVDMIRLQGGYFENVDNRILSLYLVKHGLSDVAIFGPDRKSIHASEFLYKKAVMVVRGNYRPATVVSLDVFKSSFQQFKEDNEVDPLKTELLAELTLDNLKVDGEVLDDDFLARADLLCALDQTVIISNCSNHQHLINYLSDYKVKRLGLVIGVHELLEIINQKYFQNQDGRLLVAFGELFTRNIKIYAYPALQEGSLEILNGSNLPVPQGIRFLYQHLLDSAQLVEVKGYNEDLLGIFPNKVLEMIRTGNPDWENMLPPKLVTIIKEQNLFGYPQQKMEFEH